VITSRPAIFFRADGRFHFTPTDPLFPSGTFSDTSPFSLFGIRPHPAPPPAARGDANITHKHSTPFPLSVSTAPLCPYPAHLFSSATSLFFFRRSFTSPSPWRQLTFLDAETHPLLLFRTLLLYFLSSSCGVRLSFLFSHIHGLSVCPSFHTSSSSCFRLTRLLLPFFLNDLFLALVSVHPPCGLPSISLFFESSSFQRFARP